MKKATTIVLATLCITASCAQKKIKGSGNVVTIERMTSDYDGISVSGFYDVELVEGTEGKLTLKGEDNILDNIETEVKSGNVPLLTSVSILCKMLASPLRVNFPSVPSTNSTS